MEPESSQRINISNEGDFNSLLGALIRELPDVFEAEVLTKLGLKDHFALAQVNKECKDVVYKLSPVEFLSTCPISRMDSSPYDHNLYMYVY
jgi:hypothetical protein